MSRHKLKKFAQLQSFPNYYDNLDVRDPQNIVLNGQIVDIKGKWLSEHFKNDNPITLELACGRGEYAVALGRMFPERNFIGVDIKGARIHQGATTALNEGLSNVAFLRTRIEQIEHFFVQNEVSEIWITFPDPFLRDSKADKRLTAVPFLNRYRTFLQPEGIVHLKTDSPDLYDFTLDICKNTEGVNLLLNDDDIHAKPLIMNELSVQTYYEKANIARSTIKYVRFKI
jgi:tRNA (guanine-N7-)-methyltransferase